jgi:hypothetical protein
MSGVERVRESVSPEVVQEIIRDRMEAGETDPEEFEVLTQVAQMVIQESRLPRIADALNREGHRMRNGENWTPSGVFELMPRLIDSSPRIFSTVDWPMRRRVTANL